MRGKTNVVELKNDRKLTCLTFDIFFFRVFDLPLLTRSFNINVKKLKNQFPRSLCDKNFRKKGNFGVFEFYGGAHTNMKNINELNSVKINSDKVHLCALAQSVLIRHCNMVLFSCK